MHELQPPDTVNRVNPSICS